MPRMTIFAKTTRWGHRHFLVLMTLQHVLDVLYNAFQIMWDHLESWFWSTGFYCVCLGGYHKDARCGLSAYELQRLENIVQKEAFLSSLKIWQVCETITNSRPISCSPCHSLSLSHFVSSLTFTLVSPLLCPLLFLQLWGLLFSHGSLLRSITCRRNFGPLCIFLSVILTCYLQSVKHHTWIEHGIWKRCQIWS